MSGMLTRGAALRQILTGHRRELQDHIRLLHEERPDRPPDDRDVIERAGTDSQEDLGLALLQRRAEMLGRVDDALMRLASGAFGACVDCGWDIGIRRLRVLPLAVRCQACEGRRELARGETGRMARPLEDASSFAESALR